LSIGLRKANPVSRLAKRWHSSTEVLALWTGKAPLITVLLDSGALRGACVLNQSAGIKATLRSTIDFRGVCRPPSLRRHRLLVNIPCAVPGYFATRHGISRPLPQREKDGNPPLWRGARRMEVCKLNVEYQGRRQESRITSADE
jgi:hypothetical protein